MTVTPIQVTAARPTTLRFTYTAARRACRRRGRSPSSTRRVDRPVKPPGQAGYVSASRGLLSVSGRRITLTGVTLGPGQQVSITYAAATAPGTAGLATFATSQQPDGTATLAALRMSPEVTVALPAGTRGRMSDWLPILLVVTGLVLAAAAAGLLAFRPLRRGGHPVPDGERPGRASFRAAGVGDRPRYRQAGADRAHRAARRRHRDHDRGEAAMTHDRPGGSGHRHEPALRPGRERGRGAGPADPGRSDRPGPGPGTAGAGHPPGRGARGGRRGRRAAGRLTWTACCWPGGAPTAT